MTPSKKRGRPPKENTLMSVSWTIEQEQYQRLQAIANARNESVSVIVREIIASYFAENDKI